MEALVRSLKRSITEGMPLEGIVDAFERMCQTPLEEDMILFETGTFDFTGEPMFYFSLVRQGPGDDDEFVQIHVDVLYPPAPENEAFQDTEWSDDCEGNFFDFIRKSPAYAYAKGEQYVQVKIYMDET